MKRIRSNSRKRATGAAGLFDELVIDLFAGGGGASMGIEKALHRAVDVAINHDVEAVAMHKANHPHTLHLCENVRRAVPLDVTAGRPVGLLWMSPDCTHFSGARGAKPVKKKIRSLANVAIRWARDVKPRVIMLENVREFTTWGPCIPKLGEDGQPLRWPDGSMKMIPCPLRKGKTFRQWKRKLEQLGYVIETRILNAADYGAATHRRRFFLIARCDGRPIMWPEPTHGPGRSHPYRTAAEFIDWSRPCPSIFLTPEEAKPLRIRRPLAPNTLRRIAAGIKRFVLENPRPFIVRCNHGGDEFRDQPIEQPLGTVTSHHGYGVVDAELKPIKRTRKERAAQQAYEKQIAEENLARWETNDVAPLLTAQFGEAPGQEPRAHRADEPIPTITPRQGGGFPLVTAHLSQFFGGMVGKEPDQPLPTVTSVDHNGVVAAFLGTHYGDRPNGTIREGHVLDDPHPTVTANGKHSVLTMANLVRLGQAGGNGAYVNGVTDPLTTITSQAEHCLAAAHLQKLYGTSTGAICDGPAPTITGQGNHLCDCRAFLSQYNGTSIGTDLRDPMNTITPTDRFGIVTVAGVDYEISDIGLRMLRPRELFGCQGFPGSYILDPFVKGRKLPKDAQTRMVGNSVPPQLPEALVRANFPEECPRVALRVRSHRRKLAEMLS